MKKVLRDGFVVAVSLLVLAGCSDSTVPGSRATAPSSPTSAAELSSSSQSTTHSPENIEFFGKTHLISEADYSTTDDDGNINFVLYYGIGFIGLAEGDSDPVYQQVEVGQVIGEATVAEDTNMGFDLIDGTWELTESDVRFTGPIELIGELTKTPEGEMLEPGTLTFTAAKPDNGFMPYIYDTYGGNIAPWFLLGGSTPDADPYNPEVDFPNLFSKSNTVPAKVTLDYVRMLKTNRATGVNRAELMSVVLLNNDGVPVGDIPQAPVPEQIEAPEPDNTFVPVLREHGLDAFVAGGEGESQPVNIALLEQWLENYRQNQPAKVAVMRYWSPFPVMFILECDGDASYTISKYMPTPNDTVELQGVYESSVVIERAIDYIFGTDIPAENTAKLPLNVSYVTLSENGEIHFTADLPLDGITLQEVEDRAFGELKSLLAETSGASPIYFKTVGSMEIGGTVFLIVYGNSDEEALNRGESSGYRRAVSTDGRLVLSKSMENGKWYLVDDAEQKIITSNN